MSGLAGMRGTGNFGTDERPKSFREMILWMQPNGMSPLFALTSKVKKLVKDDPEYSWWAEPNALVRLQVSAEAAAGITTITVDSPDPSASTLGANYGTATHLKAGDILMVEPTADAEAFAPEYIEVVSTLSDTAFTVKRGAYGSTPATIANDAWLFLVGSVYAEGTGAPQAVSRNPQKYNNLVQIFKDSYEITGTVNSTKFRTGDAWSNDKKRKTFDHARNIEMAMLFGKKHETVGENGKPLRSMGGLRSQISAETTHVFSSGVTPETLLDAAYTVFDYESPAGDERICFMGNDAANALSKMVLNDGATNVSWGAKVQWYGMNLREFIMPQGRLLMRTHPLLNRHPLYSKSMWIIDFSSLAYVTLKGRDTKAHDDVQNKEEDLRRGFFQTDCSLMVDRGGMTCGYLGNIT